MPRRCGHLGLEHGASRRKLSRKTGPPLWAFCAWISNESDRPVAQEQIFYVQVELIT